MRAGGACPGTQRVPYVEAIINTVDYSDKLLFCEHHEQSYDDEALLIFNNNARTFDSVNLLGKRFTVGYGYGVDFSYAPDLWVKGQNILSKQGKVWCELECEGQWRFLREQRMIATGSPASGIEPIDSSQPSDPYYTAIFNKTHTVYDLIKMVIESMPGGWTIGTAPDDDIINTFRPVFSFKGLPSAADVLYRLISMTKCFLRPTAGLIWEVVYPQSSDAIDATYYSYQHPYFKEYAERKGLVVPNRFIVLAGFDPQNVQPPILVGDSGAYTGPYVEVIEPVLKPEIDNQNDADNQAAAFLIRAQAARMANSLVIPHDGRVELWDKLAMQDRR